MIGPAAESAAGLLDLSGTPDRLPASDLTCPGGWRQIHKAYVDGEDAQALEYSDVAVRRAESGQITSDGSTIGTTMVTWIDKPNFWAKGLLIVLYVGQDKATIEALSAILGEPPTGG